MPKQEKKSEQRPGEVCFLKWKLWIWHHSPGGNWDLYYSWMPPKGRPEGKNPETLKWKDWCYSSSEDCLQSQQNQTAGVEGSRICGLEKICHSGLSSSFLL